jgi:hypothetical protein
MQPMCLLHWGAKHMWLYCILQLVRWLALAIAISLLLWCMVVLPSMAKNNYGATKLGHVPNPWGVDYTHHYWQCLLASPSVRVWKMMGEHLYINIPPNNVTAGTGRKRWCDQGMRGWSHRPLLASPATIMWKMEVRDDLNYRVIVERYPCLNEVVGNSIPAWKSSLYLTEKKKEKRKRKRKRTS